MSRSHPASERLRAILHKPGPYLTAYFDVTDAALADQWDAVLPRVKQKGVPDEMIAATTARTRLPVEADVGGWGIIVAADGSTEVFTSPDAPRRPIVNVSPIPYMAPALEWDHRDVPHAVVVATSEGIDIVTFVSGVRPSVATFDPDPEKSAEALAALVIEHDMELVVVGGDDDSAQAAASRYRSALPPSALINVLPESETLSVDDFSDAVVREVATIHATRTVNTLKEFRFEKSHGSAAEGTAGVLDALRADDIRVLLIHDDPDDERVVAMSESEDIESIGAMAPTEDNAHAVRLVDAAIASALIHGADVHIIPTTGRTGPDDNVGVILDRDFGEPVTAGASIEAPTPANAFVDSPYTNAAEHGGGAIVEPGPYGEGEIVV